MESRSTALFAGIRGGQVMMIIGLLTRAAVNTAEQMTKAKAARGAT